MRTPCRCPPPGTRAQRGLTLLELFVAMVLGLLVVGGLLLAFLGSGISSRQLRALAEMTQDAQMALNLVARDLQMAGYAEPSHVSGTTVTPISAFRPVFGCDGPFLDKNADFAAADCAPAPAPGSAASAPSLPANSAVEINYQIPDGIALKTQGSAAPQLPVDCKGSGVGQAAGSSAYLVSNRYYIDTPAGTGTDPALYCASSAGTAGSRTVAPLVDQVESLAISYGIAPGWDAADRTTWRPAYYVSATDLQASPPPVTDWPSKVVAVRLCIRMRSSEQVLTADDSARYIDCDRVARTSPDRRLRRVFVATVALRNKVN